MNKGIQKLVQLAKLDEGIIACDSDIKKENEKLAHYNEIKQDLDKRIVNSERVVNESKNAIIKNDLHLKDLDVKLEKISSNSKLVSTDKAIKALNIEEEVAHESIKFANSEIDRLNDIITNEEESLKLLKANLEEETQTIAQTKDGVSTAIAELQTEQENKEKEKEKIIDSLEDSISSIYIKIKKWAKQSVAVPIKNRACYGCYLKVGDSFYNLLKTTDEILTCPNCSRIVYLDESSTVDDDEGSDNNKSA